MLSFDEFRAINKRKNNQQQSTSTDTSLPPSSIAKGKEDKKDPPLTSSSTSPSTSSSTNILKRLGQFLEMHEIQIVIILLILFDSFASFMILILTSSPSSSSSSSMELYLHILTSFTTFTIFFFLLELFFLFLSFQIQFLFHLGYLLDLIILGYEVYETIQFNGGIRSRVLNIFRLWRIIRLFQSLVNIERDSHNETIRLLESVQLKKQLLEEKVITLNDDLIKEQVSFILLIYYSIFFPS